MSSLGYLFLILACILLSGFFSGSETALLRLRKEHLEKDIKEAKGPTAFAVRDLLHNPAQLLVTILLGNNVVNIVGAASASALAIHYLGENRGVLVASLVMTFVILIFAEILPKAISAGNPLRVAYWVGLPLYLIHKLLKPLHWTFDKCIEPIVRRITGVKEEPVGTLDEIMAMAKSTELKRKAGSPMAIITSTAGAAQMRVKDIMTPRPEIVAFSIKTNASDLLDRLIDERYTRIPIYLGNLDKVLGLVHLKDLIKAVRDKQQDLRTILKPVIKVPETKPILSLLSEMQRSLIHMAIVKDEFGITQGLVSTEDILEQIVGEIRDEFDIEELASLRKLQNGSYEADGTIYANDFNRDTGWDLPTEHGDTLSGIVFNKLGRVPLTGEQVQIGSYLFTVLHLAGTRITRVQIKKQDSEPEDNS